MSLLEKTVTIENKRGLHARAAAKFVRLVEAQSAKVTVYKDDMVVCGSSIMGLLMLSASITTQVRITSEGEGAEKILNDLVSLIGRRFDEEA